MHRELLVCYDCPKALHEHLRAVIPSTLLCVPGKKGASGSLSWDTSSSALIASGESGTERCELLVFSVLQGVGDMIRHSLSVSQSLTLRPAISDTLQPVSLRQTNSAQAVMSFE